MFQKSILALSLLLSTVGLVGCEGSPEKIRDLDIVSVELKDPDQYSAGLVPEGRSYSSASFVVHVREKDGSLRRIENADHRDFEATGEHLEPQGSNFEGTALSFVTHKNSFTYRNSTFKLTLTVKDNPFAGQAFEFAIDWAGFTSLSFSGVSGGDGSDLDVFATRITDAQGAWTLFKVEDLSRQGSQVFAVPAGNSFRIASNGGHGDAGADGSSGVSAYNCDGEVPVPATNGGNGENGEDGGDAGLIRLFHDAPSLLEQLALESKAGLGGSGGRGGSGGNQCSGVPASSGTEGRHGADGLAATPIIVQKTPQEIRAAFAGVDLTGVQFVD